MLNEKMEKALNAQINAEFYSAYLYLSMAAYFEAESLSGFANWMRTQFQEEQFHAQKMFDYINERGGRVLLTQIQQPETEWDSILKVFEQTLLHEVQVSKLINDLIELSRNEEDNATYNFLQWYVSEQVEEEATVETILKKLKMIGNSGTGILMMDQEMMQRVFTPPIASNV